MRDGATEERETDDREEETSLADVIDRLAETGGGAGAGDEGGDGDGDGEVTVNALLDTFADRSLGVLLTALGSTAGRQWQGNFSRDYWGSRAFVLILRVFQSVLR